MTEDELKDIVRKCIAEDTPAHREMVCDLISEIRKLKKEIEYLTDRNQKLLMERNPENRFRDCGCVWCDCENENQCQGCGAKMCDEHKILTVPHVKG